MEPFLFSVYIVFYCILEEVDDLYLLNLSLSSINKLLSVNSIDNGI